MSDFGAVLESGVELLRRLPRRRARVEEARRAAAEWGNEHPAAGAQLVVDVRPGTPVVDYDLLLAHPGGGTVALTAPSDEGVPWLIEHSTHWAAGQLVSVDDVHLSVAQALTMLRSLSRRDMTPHDEIVDQCLILNEVMSDDEPLTTEDLQAAADEFRRGRGLYDRAATVAWLEQMGMSPAQFEEYIGGIARRRRFRRRKEAELAPEYLAGHRSRFDRARAVWAVGSERWTAATPAELLAMLPASTGEAQVTIGDRWAGELPEPLRDAEAGAVAGPVEQGTGFFTGAVLNRRPAEDDAETLAAAGRAAFAAWLAERRGRASIEWHWL
ncbi:TIGR04500 family putative peptide maturation system protein [Sphaerisporangium perillae]|uniref:TIGR04500 family putative peptide maturation system protein n=1 Tax=Sphaerisporangium perillae TaxID=2935860 RepID=UPI00200D0EC7|nr:TIGR04500 family putative peptide maturation system protein [Sphaerisporangium perillae]